MWEIGVYNQRPIKEGKRQKKNAGDHLNCLPQLENTIQT